MSAVNSQEADHRQRDPLEASRCAAVILAAGSSSRLGQPKQLVRLSDDPAGEKLLERTIRIAAAAGLHPVYVVVRERDPLAHSPSSIYDTSVVWVENPHATEGMAASLRLGVSAAQPTVSGVVVLACDQPAVTADHLMRLAKAGEQGKRGKRIVASSYAARKGVPAYFPRSAFAALMALSGDTGARGLLQQADAIALPHGEIDIDTPEDLDAARRLFR